MKPSSANRQLQSDVLMEAEVQVRSTFPPEMGIFRNSQLTKSLCDVARNLSSRLREVINFSLMVRF
jgi:hypothetical protein